MERAKPDTIRVIPYNRQRAKSGFKVGRRYRINQSSLARIADRIPADDPIDLRRGCRFEGDYKWTMWLQSLRKVTVEIGSSFVHSLTIDDEPDADAPNGFR